MDAQTGWCERGDCGECHGKLLRATGWRWFCACACHPEPTIKPEHSKALVQFRRDREAITKAA